MEIQGKIIHVLNELNGVGKDGKTWRVQPFVLETSEQYPRKVYIEVFGDDRIKNCINSIKVDNTVTVGFDIESREFGGRWYTSIRAWKVESEGNGGEGAKRGNTFDVKKDSGSDLHF